MEYPVIPLHIGMEKPLRCLHIADTHLLFADGRDNRTKYDIALRRYGEYVYSNIGRNLPYFLDALLYAQKHCDMLWISRIIGIPRSTSRSNRSRGSAVKR